MRHAPKQCGGLRVIAPNKLVRSARRIVLFDLPGKAARRGRVRGAQAVEEKCRAEDISAVL